MFNINRFYPILEESKTIVLLLSLGLGACGEKQDFDQGNELESAVLGGGGATRTDTTPVVVTTGPVVTVRPAPVYNIVNVTQIVTATSGLPDWTAAMLPFNGTPVGIGDPVVNAQTAFQYNFSYPQNNYQFVEAHLVIDSRRDDSDTEAIFVDGVLSGRPPSGSVNTSSSEISDKIYEGNGLTTPNTFFIDFSLAHYKVATRNTFDLLLSDLLVGSAKTSIDVLKDNQLSVVTGDDSRVDQAYLVIRGRTISDSALSCSQSPTYSFTNLYVHNDGNTVGATAFDSPVTTPSVSWGQAAGVYGYNAVEFYFDAPLPKVEIENIAISKANILLTARHQANAPTAVVVNGVGVSQSGFDRTLASSIVETWIDDGDAVTALNAFVSTMGTGSDTITTLDLISIFGSARVGSLLAQGKLNVSLAGANVVYAANTSSSRVLGTRVDGPELDLAGTYSTEVCVVPDNPDSALTQEGIRVEEAQTSIEEGSSEVLNDGAGPVISSLQATEIGSNKATILWLTDEPSTATVNYGVGDVSLNTVNDTTPTTFHQIELTGLAPYKYYNFKVTSTDKYGNASSSNVSVFVTLR